ncbi:MAG: uracil phosphoribosyltransferase [Planctomycetes bacterium]|nr:uracil phosphoribosyltransferase [Planctomycetota bacterium]
MQTNERAYGFRGGWELPHRYGDSVHVLNSPFLRSVLARLGGNEIRHPEINESLRVVYRDLLIQVASRELPTVRAEVPTRMIASEPRAVYRGEVLDPAHEIVVVSIIRAGIIPAQTCFDMLNLAIDPRNVRMDHLMLARISDEHGRVTGVSFSGSKVGGPIEGRTLLIPDPMGATGATILRAVAWYREHYGEPRKIVALPMIATPEFLRNLRDNLPECVVYTARLDRGLSAPEVLETLPGTRWDEERGLDAHSYIIPGAGGLGEVLNNSWC